MISKNNERITITTTKARSKWLKRTAKLNHMSMSDLINYFITNGQSLRDTINEKELNELTRICKTPWLGED